MPNVNYNQGAEYFCDKLMIDLEYDSETCDDLQTNCFFCRQCPHFCKQDYTIVVQDERFKKFI